jgi:hypothetical protein
MCHALLALRDFCREETLSLMTPCKGDYSMGGYVEVLTNEVLHRNISTGLL